MKRFRLYVTWLLGLLLLIASCSEDEYDYPSVRLEFVTVKAGADGSIQSLVPDKGTQLQVLEDRTKSSIASNASRRVMSNYEVVLTDGVATARIYSLQNVVTPEPKLADDPAFAGGLQIDPVSVTSIWIGRDYLNMILDVKVQGGKTHVFGIVEEGIEETDAETIVTLTLFHNANKDKEYYNRRAYISVPLTKYAIKESDKAIRIKFKYHTYGKNGESVETDKYCQPGFEYVPDMN